MLAANNILTVRYEIQYSYPMLCYKLKLEIAIFVPQCIYLIGKTDRYAINLAEQQLKFNNKSITRTNLQAGNNYLIKKMFTNIQHQYVFAFQYKLRIKVLKTVQELERGLRPLGARGRIL